MFDNHCGHGVSVPTTENKRYKFINIMVGIPFDPYNPIFILELPAVAHRLNVQILNVFCVLFNELSSWLYLVAHKDCKGFVCGFGVA